MEFASNFLHEIIDEDIANGLTERIHTRFPPEPNGYLHIGSAKAIFINWSIAKKYNGLFNLRYDDTNPVKEDTEYVDSIWEDIKWLTGAYRRTGQPYTPWYRLHSRVQKRSASSCRRTHPAYRSRRTCRRSRRGSPLRPRPPSRFTITLRSGARSTTVRSTPC